jgi:hypothetical protein
VNAAGGKNRCKGEERERINAQTRVKRRCWHREFEVFLLLLLFFLCDSISFFFEMQAEKRKSSCEVGVRAGAEMKPKSRNSDIGMIADNDISQAAKYRQIQVLIK